MCTCTYDRECERVRVRVTVSVYVRGRVCVWVKGFLREWGKRRSYCTVVPLAVEPVRPLTIPLLPPVSSVPWDDRLDGDGDTSVEPPYGVLVVDPILGSATAT